MVDEGTRRCKATARTGAPCTARPVRPSGWCWFHDPGIEAERAAGRRLGGYARSNAERARKRLPAEPLDNGELVRYLGEVFKHVIDGTVEPRVGTAAASIAKVMVDIQGAGEVERLAEEVELLKALLARRSG